MAESLALIDYGAGNLHSVQNAIKAAGAERVVVTSDPEIIRRAQRIILPGVGSFRSCAEGLRSIPGMIEALEESVMVNASPFIGICVGMQLLATRGLEHGATAGLGWIAGDVIPIEADNTSIKVPHMGWNDVLLSDQEKDHWLLEKGEAYFLHSYHFAVREKTNIIAMTFHGSELVAAVERDNIIGVQFHPEKSQKYGLAMLERFLEWRP